MFDEQRAMAMTDWASIKNLPPIEGFALIAGSSAEECRAQGAEWSFERVLEQRLPVQTAMLICRLAGCGIPYAKTVIGFAMTRGVSALGQAIDLADADAATQVLADWCPRYEVENACLVRALLETFSG